MTYQSLQYDMASDEETLDMAATYSLGSGFTLIGGFFTYDPDNDTSDLAYIGYNLTLVKALTGNVKVFAEWLRYDYDDENERQGETDDHLSLGIRIDFNAQII